MKKKGKEIMQIYQTAKHIIKLYILLLFFFLLKQVYWIWFPFKEETSHSATLSVVLKKKREEEGVDQK